MQEQGLSVEHYNIYMKARAIQIVLKQVLESIKFAVMAKKSDASMTNQQEEQAYHQFIEDFLNCTFAKQEDTSHPNLVLMSCVPAMMHGSFVTKEMQLKIMGKIKKILGDLEVEHLDVKTFAQKVIDGHIAKVNEKPKEKKQVESKAAKKSVKDTIGRKRTYADKEGVEVSPNDNTVKVAPNSRKQRNI